MIVATCEVLLLGLLIAGAAHDIWFFRLPNWLTLSTALVALPWLALSVSSVPSAFLHLLAAGLMLAVGMLAFRFNMLGGGDVKWLASLILWVGFNLDFMRFLIMTSLFGGVLAAILYIASKLGATYGSQGGKQHLPYGVAIAAAGIDFWIRRSHLGQAFAAFTAS